MGFETRDHKFKIPVLDTQAYRQFGNSVVVPAVAFVARVMRSHIESTIGKSHGVVAGGSPSGHRGTWLTRSLRKSGAG